MADKRQIGTAFPHGSLEVENGRLDAALIPGPNGNDPNQLNTPERIQSSVGGGMLSRRETFSRLDPLKNSLFDEENFGDEEQLTGVRPSARKFSILDFENLSRGNTGTMTVVSSIITAAIGSGVVEMPNSVASAGWIPGILGCLMVNGLIAYVSGVCLSKAIFMAETLERRRLNSFSDMADVTFGIWGRRCVMVFYHVIMILITTIYILLMALSTNAIISQFSRLGSIGAGEAADAVDASHADGVWMEAICVTVAMMVLNQLPLVWVAKISVVGAAASVATLIVVAASPFILHADTPFESASWFPRVKTAITAEEFADFTAQGAPEGSTLAMTTTGAEHEYWEITGAGGFLASFMVYMVAMSKVFFGYNYTLVIPPLQDAMTTPKSMGKIAVPAGVGTVFVVYTVVAIAGVLAVGEGNLLTGANLYEALQNLAKPGFTGEPVSDAQQTKVAWIVILLAITILANLIVSHPLTLSGTLQELEAQLGAWWVGKRKNPTDGTTDTTDTDTTETAADAAATEGKESANKQPPTAPKWLAVILRASVVSLTFLIVAAFGCKKDRLGPMIGITGSVLIAGVLFVFPLVCYQIIRRRYRATFEPDVVRSAAKNVLETLELAMHVLMALLCAGCAVFSCIDTIMG